jgi:hypothetical protein
VHGSLEGSQQAVRKALPVNAIDHQDDGFIGWYKPVVGYAPTWRPIVAALVRVALARELNSGQQRSATPSGCI